MKKEKKPKVITKIIINDTYYATVHDRLNFNLFKKSKEHKTDYLVGYYSNLSGLLKGVLKDITFLTELGDITIENYLERVNKEQAFLDNLVKEIVITHELITTKEMMK